MARSAASVARGGARALALLLAVRGDLPCRLASRVAGLVRGPRVDLISFRPLLKHEKRAVAVRGGFLLCAYVVGWAGSRDISHCQVETLCVDWTMAPSLGGWVVLGALLEAVSGLRASWWLPLAAGAVAFRSGCHTPSSPVSVRG